MATPEIFAVVHKDCRHVAAIHNTREAAELVAANLWPRQSDWYVRTGNDAHVYSLLHGESCFKCDQRVVANRATRRDR
jgi:hypothetical protein